MHATRNTPEAHPARTIARQRLAITALAGTLGLVVGLGLGSDTPSANTQPQNADRTAAAPFQYVAGGNRLYRIQDTGEIEYLIVDFAHGSVAGVPGWASLRIDTSLSRDRMGNMIRANGN
ncbi:MAG: hypothetical protein Q9O74_11565 [Planctomycetota bacterium]|nr:hypothetical protein [Planctomycetota bacterium]